jgi:putative nucleotidyltransferase with HDIG domain
VIGAHIGNYRIVTELGAGAMGEVYFAEHAVMGRRAAVKIIREELSGNAEMVERFVNEARLVNKIGHPNIVEITDFGQIAGRYYIMMELLEGETLEERLERSPRMPEDAARHIARQISAALAAAHKLGVVHRDLKPENIYVQQRPGQPDFVKVLDFGIAKLMGSARPATGTMPGTLLGTPHYMSPEQCQGAEALDHRSDVYSLGVILYRMLTGELPFDSETLMGLLYAQANQAPRELRDLNPVLSTQVQDLVLKALAKRPEDRFQDMSSFRRALDGATIAPHVGVRPASAELKGQVQLPARPLPRGTVARDEAARRNTDPAPAPERISHTEIDPKQGQRVGSKLARILIERIHKNRLVLPNMPSAARECLDLLEDPDGGMGKVAKAIGRDPIIAPQIVRRAQSAMLGGGAPVRTIEQAVARLGVRQLRALLIDLCARKLFESKNPAIRRATRGLWEHSVAVAVLSRAIARRRRDVDPDAAYMSGLLHDVGKPVAASLLLDAERNTEGSPNQWLGEGAWLDVIAECHREVGVALARSWGLQDDVVLAIARSERYSVDGPGSTASVVCFANALVKREGIYTGQIDPDSVDALIREGLQLFKIEAEMLDTLMAELRDHQTTDAAQSG